jgi:hypothetical protein
MKKAVADLAPTLPVKVISFSNKSAFYADLSHDMYVSGDATQRPLTPGYQFRGNQRKRERRSLRLEHVEIFTSPMNTNTAFEHKIPIKKHSGDFSLECSVINLMLLLFRALLTRQAQPCINSSSAAFSMNLFTDIFFFFAAAATRL